jgi:hypothetical protein
MTAHASPQLRLALPTVVIIEAADRTAESCHLVVMKRR